MLDVNNFDSMRIGLASPEQIRKWSHGEVKKPETINYRTLKPEREGLFCEKIFGPTRDWECHCGKYKRIRYKGIICDRCGVEVTRSKVRRDRMGHIELAAPVSHIWYFKGIPSRMGLILDISPRSLEKVLYFASYIVLDPGDTPLMKKQLLNENEYREHRDKYGNAFKIGMGAEAIKKLLEELDLEKMSRELRQELKEVSGQRKIRAIRRLEVVEAFRKSGNNPAWMILDVVPVIPPELRPMVQLDGGRFATSDLNDLYRRVINRNNRLKRLLDLGAPDIIVRNEKRMLQEAVDALIDNGRRGRPVTGPGNRPLKSLSDMLKGKQGRFRQNLLGKRVDYSGRSVIVVGPELKLHQCGLPKEMALELFKPFVMKKLVNAGHAHNIKSAKRMVERVRPEVWDVLEEVIKEHPVLLNRAPTLHRLGIQAFEPVLSEGRAIKIHPLVCTAYNADFDGDQMAVHVPLSAEAQAEARMLMLSAHNILSTKDGRPVTTPTQDMVLGAYYLTIVKEPKDGKIRAFVNLNEALLAYQHKELELQEKIRMRIKGYGLVHTTLGRMIFNEVLPPELRPFVKEDDGWHLGKVMDKKQLGKLVADSYQTFGNAKTADVVDSVKRLGFSFACRAGITIAISDIKIPEAKKEIIATAEAKVNTIDKQYRRGLITDDERYKKTIDLWTKATDDVTTALMNSLDRFNNVYMMANSGARGNIQQIRQLAGMRGLMADPSGRIIDLPIKANFREGLTVLEYFISTHGARKGLADTALRTADSGYLTRRLVDVAQDVIVREEDCDVVGINLVRERARLAQSSAGAIDMLKDSLQGRILAQDVMNPKTADMLLSQGKVLDEDALRLIGENGVPEIMIEGEASEVEEDVGRVAAETIVLGAPEEKVRAALKEAMIREMLGKNTTEAIKTSDGVELVPADTPLTEEHIEAVLASSVKEVKVRNNNIRGIEVEAIKEGSGIIESLRDRIVGRVAAEDIVDPATGETIVKLNELITEELAEKVVKVREKVSIRSVLTCRSRYGVCIKCYGRNLGTSHMVDVGEAVGIIAAQSIGEPGTQLTMRTFHTGGVAGDDITQGLPRVEELFEARKPKRQAIITEVEGTVEIKEIKGMRRVTIYPLDASLGEERVYPVPYGARLIVSDGQRVEPGDRLTEGAVNPHDILRVSGLKATQRYLVYEVQKVYKSQGVEINDKHIEVMVRQMLHKVKVEEAGDTELLPGEYIDLNTFEEENAKAIEAGGDPAVARPILLGITKASLATDSFLSAASFQETTRVLTEAAIKGKIDPLLGLKENVIIGKLVPAGTGMSRYRNVKLKTPVIEQTLTEIPVE
ncbi:DNA-directed RNA polymerase subunit beta' [Sporomusa acidovorans]|uniref:DNA-directed RNA polymerase subunit beta' n=1 Tax=Sporomusa acidovorans (strain ATCC 49682 / DSM 3132 / Mol) TaxID=1123286 RepID=A0ABZ3IWJ7_SPOA4|nr:DNA-directed RNA polymerase subunit beta' [Sporomusa acidovorans]OZC13905.1 DNA-directed RNA polymerase subunit beta' [Sporomusa acidovorans DSM 3132]SDF74607.1 DNA-directed RNA polymerase subunit beta' [Sporomusa acidovorans]